MLISPVKTDQSPRVLGVTQECTEEAGHAGLWPPFETVTKPVEKF